MVFLWVGHDSHQYMDIETFLGVPFTFLEVIALGADY